MTDAEAAETTAIVLDYLPHGRSSNDRPRYEQVPLAQALGVEDFRLFELVLEDEHEISIGEEMIVRPPTSPVSEFREVSYEGLSTGAGSEVEYVVRELVEGNEDRFVALYNEAQPITLRLHQLNLLPGIGDKLRDDILDARKRQPFEDFGDLEERINGLHDPEGIVVDRILEELQNADLKYYLFVGGGPY